MGTAWACTKAYPWENPNYIGGIETVKVNIMLRIYSNLYHVYAGLAILNPSARIQIDQYAASVTEIFKIMLEGDEGKLRERMYRAREAVFREDRTSILLSEDVLDQFTLGRPSNSVPSSPRIPPPPNSHLSLLAMVDCWANLSINPFEHLALAATPVFRMWIGVAEYLFRSPTRLDAAISAAISDVSHRSDDLEFVVAARGWSQCVSFGNFKLYEKRFMETRKFFEGRFEEATVVGSRMIQTIMESAARQ